MSRKLKNLGTYALVASPLLGALALYDERYREFVLIGLVTTGAIGLALVLLTWLKPSRSENS